jgi:hypothetical protein
MGYEMTSLKLNGNRNSNKETSLRGDKAELNLTITVLLLGWLEERNH